MVILLTQLPHGWDYRYATKVKLSTEELSYDFSFSG